MNVQKDIPEKQKYNSVDILGDKLIVTYGLSFI
jgi:hypothetical protein